MRNITIKSKFSYQSQMVNTIKNLDNMQSHDACLSAAIVLYEIMNTCMVPIDLTISAVIHVYNH